MLVLTSSWTTTSLASYFLSRSPNLPLFYPFQDSSNFYLVMSARDDRDLVNCQGPCHQVSPSVPVNPCVLVQGNWQIKRVSSTTGPYLGTVLSDAIRKQHTVADETEVLWQADRQSAGGWREGHSYRFHLVHRPKVISSPSISIFSLFFPDRTDPAEVMGGCAVDS